MVNVLVSLQLCSSLVGNGNSPYRRQYQDVVRSVSQSDIGRQPTTNRDSIRAPYSGTLPSNSQVWQSILPTQSPPPRPHPSYSNSCAPTTSPISTYPSTNSPSRRHSPQQQQQQ